jgi:DNA (cytosine-5)-methyltransferase 1
MKELSLFTGAGGGLLGTHLLGWEPVGYVEWNEYCQKVIRQRIEDGIIPRAPIFCDVRAFASEGYAEAYTGMVDVITAGFPCQPFSVSGKQLGEDDPQNMWPATRDTIDTVRPKRAFLENVTGLLANGYIRRVFGDLAEMGFNARWGVLGGHDIGGGIANGERLWIVATATDCPMLESLHIQKPIIVNTEESCRREHSRAVGEAISQDDYARVKRDADAVAEWMERVKAIGNGQMGPVAAKAWRLLT